MGKVQKKLGRLHEALASFNQALDLDPKSGNMIKAHIDRLQVYLSMLACSAHPHIYSAHQPSKPGMHPRAIKACTCACVGDGAGTRHPNWCRPDAQTAADWLRRGRCRISTKTIPCSDTIYSGAPRRPYVRSRPMTTRARRHLHSSMHASAHAISLRKSRVASAKGPERRRNRGARASA
jgi:hypothetical protein